MVFSCVYTMFCSITCSIWANKLHCSRFYIFRDLSSLLPLESQVPTNGNLVWLQRMCEKSCCPEIMGNKRGQSSLFKVCNFSKRSLFWPFTLSHSNCLLTSLILAISAVQTWFLNTHGSRNQCQFFPCRSLAPSFFPQQQLALVQSLVSFLRVLVRMKRRNIHRI